MDVKHRGFFSLRAIAFTLALAVLPWASFSSVVNPDALVRIEAPESVGVGRPFIVRLFFPHALDDLEVFWDGRSVRPEIVPEEGGFGTAVLLGAGLKAEPAIKMIVVETLARGRKQMYVKGINVVDHAYGSETLSVDPDLIHPPERERERIEREREACLKAIRTVSAQRRWRLPFSLPVKGKMLSRFGLHRVFNGDAKRRHKGLDFRAWEGTPIHAVAPGRVVLAGDFYFAGKCAFIDHGNGVVSMYVHMSKVLVKQGEPVERGGKIGLSGATGRATGAHLHLGVFVQGVAVDPEPLFAMEEK